MGKDLALYLGAFMCATIILIIPGVIFLLYWAVTRNDGEDKTQYVEHHHHYEENKTINVDAREFVVSEMTGRHTFKHTSKNDNFQGYLELK